jgi:hypothetical protein
VPGRGYGKPRNFIGTRRKGYASEKKHAHVKLIQTDVAGRGIAARRDFSVGDYVVEYGGLLVKTGLNLNSARGVERAGLSIDKGASYLLQLSSKDGAPIHQWRLGGFRHDAERGLLGSFANDPYGRVCPATNLPLSPNVRYEMRFGTNITADHGKEDQENFDYPQRGVPWLVCIKPIVKGEEILVDYGWSASVWRSHLAMEAETKLSCFDSTIFPSS